MSVLTYIRAKARGSLDFEGQVFGYAYDLFDQVAKDVGAPNPYDFTIDEDPLMTDDEIDELEASCDEDEDFEEPVDQELSRRGQFFSPGDVKASLEAYLTHFKQNPTLKAGRVEAQNLVPELEEMIALVGETDTELRIYLG